MYNVLRLCFKFELIPIKFELILKMAITRKIEVGMSSNLLHSISTLICIRKCNKNF